MDKYVVFCSKSEWFKYMFLDSQKKADVFVARNGISPFGSKGVNGFVSELFFSTKVSFLFPRIVCLKHYIYRRISGCLKFKYDDRVILIFTDTNKLSHDKEFIQYCRKHYKNVVLVRWFLDLMDIALLPEEQELSFCRSNYDVIITYDQREAKKYDFKFVESPYSRDITISKRKTNYDIVFVGTAKMERDSGKRYKRIIEAYHYFKSKGLKLKFYIFGVPENDQIKSNDIVYNTYLPYREVLKLNMESKCILEITQENETGTTLRLFEAIAYKKKLVISNVDIVNNPLFNPKQMFVFKNVHDIDLDFIVNDEKCEYSSPDIISSSCFFKTISKLCDNQ